MIPVLQIRKVKRLQAVQYFTQGHSIMTDGPRTACSSLLVCREGHGDCVIEPRRPDPALGDPPSGKEGEPGAECRGPRPGLETPSGT